jgi:hypothetical protein
MNIVRELDGITRSRVVVDVYGHINLGSAPVMVCVNRLPQQVRYGFGLHSPSYIPFIATSKPLRLGHQWAIRTIPKYATAKAMTK